MTTAEQYKLLKKGACFNCKQTGHWENECPKKNPKPWRKKIGPSINTKKETPKYLPQKFSAKETFAYIRELLAKDAKELKNLMVRAKYNKQKGEDIIDKVENF